MNTNSTPTAYELENMPPDLIELYYGTFAERELKALREAVEALAGAARVPGLAVTRQLPTDLLALRETGQSVRTLRAAITAGQLPAAKVGREFQVRRGDLEAWVNAKAVAPRARPAPELSPADRAIAAAQRRGALRVV